MPDPDFVMGDILFAGRRCGAIIPSCGRVTRKGWARGRRLRRNRTVFIGAAIRRRSVRVVTPLLNTHVKKEEEDGEIVSTKINPLERGDCPDLLHPVCRRTGSAIETDSGASWRAERSSRETSLRLPAAPRRGRVRQALTSPIPLHAAGTGTASRGHHILAPSVEENWPTSG